MLSINEKTFDGIRQYEASRYSLPVGASAVVAIALSSNDCFRYCLLDLSGQIAMLIDRNFLMTE